MFALVVAFAMSNVLAASTNPINAETPESISTQISKLLADPGFEVASQVDANVTFMINGELELVVVSVDTDNEEIADFIKQRLNYKKVETNDGQKTFNLPVQIVPGD